MTRSRQPSSVISSVFKPIVFALVILAISFGLAEIGARVLLNNSDSEREHFASSTWRWPIYHFPSFDGPLMGAHVAMPFWGFGNNPKIDGVNALGFFDDEEFPYQRKDNEVVVALLGGSVAEGVHEYIEKYFEENQAKQLKPGCGVKVKVLNMAVGAVKQPSQFYIFSYFLDSFDIAVNLDGHNDAFFESGASWPASFPTFMREMYIVSQKKQALLSRSYRYARLQYLIANLVHEQPVVLDSAVVFQSLKAMFEFAGREKEQLLEEIYLVSNSKQNFGEGDKTDELIDVWKKYILMQDALSKDYHKKSFYFLQPSQYAENGKVLTDDENKYAIVPSTKRRAELEVGFKKLQAASGVLVQSHVDMTDLSRLFAGEKETLFVDTCCHLNPKGKELLAKAVVDRVLPFINQQYCR